MTLLLHADFSRIMTFSGMLVQIIAAHMSSKTVSKVRRCLHYIATGLSHNKYVTCESLLEFSYGVSNDCIPQLVAERENEYVRVEAEAPVQKSDTFLIPEGTRINERSPIRREFLSFSVSNSAEPRRMVAEKRKICVRTNAHVFIGFGMELLASMLKRDTIRSSAYLPYLDPFVPLINDCLQSQYTEVNRVEFSVVGEKEKNLTSKCNSVYS